ncbi:MAG: NAD(P)/FAD-dependent oxidoreductase, partial [Candidatus Omnitrophica bacterium]|nr:NAD(P)/FAD-dependent oxidoreductase [Candidatus Omnitrophota bacterium]
MSKKIIIIGAGPVGCYSAQILKTFGFTPILVEEHREVGRPLHCTGLVGSTLFEEKKPFVITSASIINTINGAVVHCGRQHITIEKKKVAHVIDRERFDKEISRGLDILFENKFLGVERTNGGYSVETDKKELDADIVIGADGADSTVRALVSASKENIPCYRGVQLRMKSKPRYNDFVEVFLRKQSFLWIVPEADGVVRVGIISERPHHDLKSFLQELKLKGEVLDRFGGLVAVGMCRTTVKENIALVGGAACQLKPLTYGGIYFGLKSAAILASCIKENKLSEYDRLWKKELGQEITIGLKARALYNQFETKEIEDVL